MKIVFMGTPEFAIPSLEILLKNNYKIPLVVTAPDEPKGRGYKLTPPPVKIFAIENGLRVIQPENLKDERFIEEIKNVSPDLIVVVAFRILPREVFTIPPLGTVNVHASLLPRYRGAAPINWAIINGETETGVTTFFINEKVDTGDVILQKKIPIDPDETAGDLYDKLAKLGAEVLLETVKLIETGSVQTFPQDNSLATPAPKITKEMCQINWFKKSALQVHNFVRGLSPNPGAFTFLNEKLVKIYRTKIPESFEFEAIEAEPGQIFTTKKRDKLYVICSDLNPVQVIEIQVEGRKKLNAEEFLKGFKVETGEKFKVLSEDELKAYLKNKRF
ncbi:methionyl-tRNA formyltransferase [Candidatus Kryptobacter tengchongensis]|nr:methionyl-tRNA formyltransferase [Candidatus Kryptobacter tengchongensis]